MDSMKVTVAICTWNRCELLRQTLEQMTRLAVPEGVEWELLVVDNGSKDDTGAVIDAFAGRLPVRKLHEAAQGLSNARNTAVRHATGDYIVWTDDDVLADEAWLSEYVRAFRADPDAVVFGGPVEPWWPNEPPQWLVRGLPWIDFAFALRNFGSERVRVGEVITLPGVEGELRVMPFGANIAFRMAEQRAHPFDPALGHNGKRRSGGEETALVRALLAEGGHGWWVPGARVRHYIPVDRQSMSYLRRYFQGIGEVVEREAASAQPMLFGRPRWLLKEVVASELRYRARRLLSGPEVWMKDFRRSNVVRGRLRAYSAPEA